MRRDIDLFRTILLRIEGLEPVAASESPWVIIEQRDISGYEMRYHAKMLIEQGFLYEHSCHLEAANDAGSPVFKCTSDAITNSGHEFLDDVRQPKAWTETKNIAQRVGSGGLALLWDIAKSIARAEITKATGLALK